VKPAISALAKNLLQLETLPLLLLALTGTSLLAQSHPFVSFDAPDATVGTFPVKINASGQIAGFYAGASGNRGFVRNPNGTITEFSAPNVSFTVPVSLNNRGQIVGYGEINQPPATNRGFLRSPGGGFVKIMFPASRDTGTDSITDDGVIAGYYNDGVTAYHGYIRNTAGNFTSIDAPGAGTALNSGTYPLALNANGDLAGSYVDASFNSHGFLRDAGGNFTTFDVPGSTYTTVMGFNNVGDVSGYYLDASRTTAIGYIRHADGTFTTFSAPGAMLTQANSINDNGYVCGTAVSPNGVSTGFLRDPSGNLSKVSGPQPNNGGACLDINNSLRTTGSYIDNDQVTHGWVR